VGDAVPPRPRPITPLLLMYQIAEDAARMKDSKL